MDWQPISTFDPKVHTGRYLFANECNVILGHWYEGEDCPRLAYSGQECPMWFTYWRDLPPPPSEGR